MRFSVRTAGLGMCGAGVLAGLLLLTSLAGCGPSSHTKAPTDAAVAAVPLHEPSVAAAQPEATPAPRPFKLYGTLSPAELERYYAVPQVNGVRLGSPAAALPLATPPANVPVAAGYGWGVPLARPWRYIVIHHSATVTGSAASFDREHRERGWDGLGYHFVIGNGTSTGDGQVEVGYRWVRQLRGAHAGNLDYNERGIGICLVGDFENGGYPTARQMASLTALVRYLQARCGIQVANIIGHRDVPGKSTECPGRHFSVAAFRAALGGEVAVLQPTAPAPRSASAPLTASRYVPVRRANAP